MREEAVLGFLRRIVGQVDAPAVRHDVRIQIGRTLERLGRYSGAVREYREALRDAKRSRGPGAAARVAATRLRIARLAEAGGHAAAAVSILRTAWRCLKRSRRRWPDDERLVSCYAALVRFLAELEEGERGAEVARRTLKRLIADLDACARRNPSSLQCHRELADSYEALASLGELDDGGAVQPLECAVAIYRTLWAFRPEEWMRERLSSLLGELGHSVCFDRPERARDLFEEAIGFLLGYEDLGGLLHVQPYRLCHLYEALGWTCERLGDVAGAQAAYLKTLAVHEVVARRGIRDRQARREWGGALAYSGIDACVCLLELLEESADPYGERLALARSVVARGRAFVRRMRERRCIRPGEERKLLLRLSQAGQEWSAP